MVYKKVPIVDTARRCGLVIDSRTLQRSEVEVAAPSAVTAVWESII